jgi:hypothetical protein
MLNLDAKSRSKLVWIATLLAPVVVVQGVRFATSTSAAAASAASIASPGPDAAAASPTPPEQALTPAQRNAIAWLGSRSDSARFRSPMDRPDLRPEPPTSDVAPAPSIPTIPTIDKPTDDAPRGLTVTGMIAGGPGATSLCAINHRIQRIGDEVYPAWRISRIDGRNRVIVLAGPDGRTALLSPPTPSWER